MSDRKGALFRIRPATITDAPLLARHRAAMFRDMGRLAADWESALVEATTDSLRDALPRGEYLGWVAESTAPASGVHRRCGRAAQADPAAPTPGR